MREGDVFLDGSFSTRFSELCPARPTLTIAPLTPKLDIVTLMHVNNSTLLVALPACSWT
jgi:hypothetical protein